MKKEIVDTKKQKDFHYGEALEILKAGGNVSCRRWGSEGKVYVILQKTNLCYVLAVVDTNRMTTVCFTPSVENQIFDAWYIV